MKKIKLLLQLKRDELQRIVAFTTGYDRFRDHLRKLNILTEIKCNFCGKDETAKHIMCECDGFAAFRQRATGKMYCELTDYARLDFHMYRKFCYTAFERAWPPTNE